MSDDENGTATGPHAYDPEDGWNDEYGCEQCARCEVVFSPNGGYFDTVYGPDGTAYASNYAADPGDGPFFCSSCWSELETAAKQAANRSLTEYADTTTEDTTS